MKCAAYIPIKLNNERTPGKNIKEFDDGTPLCDFMFRALANATEIDEKYCFCSDERIEGYLPKEIKFLKRPSALDTSETQCHDIISAFISEVDADIIVLCHATCPFIKVSSIEKCVRMVKQGLYDSAFTVDKMREFLWMDNKPLNFSPEYAVRTQELPDVYKESIACYAFQKEMFLKTNRKVGFTPYLCEVDKYEAIDIDYPDDFKIANAVYMNILKDKYDEIGYRA